MTDRELLEKAAKAAGNAPSGISFLALLNMQLPQWNPLTDDGDALRLFCRMPWMLIETSDVGVTVRERGEAAARVYCMWTEWLDRNGGDIGAATRRAIVRAAAALADGGEA